MTPPRLLDPICPHQRWVHRRHAGRVRIVVAVNSRMVEMISARGRRRTTRIFDSTLRAEYRLLTQEDRHESD